MKELDSAKTELGALNQTLDGRTQDNQTLRDNIVALQTDLQQSKEMAGNLEQKLTSSEAENARSADKVKTLTAAVKSLEEILDETITNNSFIEASLADIKNDLNASQERLDTKQLELKALMAEKKALIDARNALNDESKQLAKSIKEQLQNSGIDSVTVNRLADNTLALKVDSSQLFRTGSSRLSDEGQQILSAVGEAIAETDNRRIMIEGHSDNVPLGAKLSAIFKDNLGLSMARALSTAKFFTDTANIPANNMSVSGAGATRPLASNDTAEGRQKNRRVEILLLPLKDQ